MTPWTVAHQAPLSMEFSRQAYWSGLPFPSPENLPYPGIKPGSPALQANSLPTEPQGKPRCFRLVPNCFLVLKKLFKSMLAEFLQLLSELIFTGHLLAIRHVQNA